ncbi:hypothetical protein EMCRGX_G010528 [Ephydatia muelleri]
MPQLRRIQMIVEHLCVLQHGNWWRGYHNCLHTQIQMTYVAYNGGKTITFDNFLLLVDACTHYHYSHDEEIRSGSSVSC